MTNEPNPYEFTSTIAENGSNNKFQDRFVKEIVDRVVYLIRFLFLGGLVAGVAWLISYWIYIGQSDRVYAYTLFPKLLLFSKLIVAVGAVGVSLILKKRVVWVIVFGIIGLFADFGNVVATSPGWRRARISENPFFGWQTVTFYYFISAIGIQILIPAILECLFWRPVQGEKDEPLKL